MSLSEPGACVITDGDFDWLRSYIYKHTGIALAPHKRHLVMGRLWKRLAHYGLKSYTDYVALIQAPENDHERQILVDLLTTNETYFFREPAHFEFLRDTVLPAYRGKPFHAWSAACSSGEEAYTLAMLLADVLGSGDWTVLGSDISERMLDAGRAGIYPLHRAKDLPPEMLSKYCLKGVRSQSGYLLVEPRLKERVKFQSVNLKRTLPKLGKFDLILLRNVLIYFDLPTKQEVLERVAGALRPGGYLFTSHVESLHGVTDALGMVRPSIFRKPSARD